MGGKKISGDRTTLCFEYNSDLLGKFHWRNSLPKQQFCFTKHRESIKEEERQIYEEPDGQRENVEDKESTLGRSSRLF